MVIETRNILILPKPDEISQLKFSKFKSHSYKSWVENNNLNKQDSFSKQNLDQNSWKILMPFVFSTKIVNNFWDTTLDSRPFAL